MDCTFTSLYFMKIEMEDRKAKFMSTAVRPLVLGSRKERVSMNRPLKFASFASETVNPNKVT